MNFFVENGGENRGTEDDGKKDEDKDTEMDLGDHSVVVQGTGDSTQDDIEQMYKTQV